IGTAEVRFPMKYLVLGKCTSSKERGQERRLNSYEHRLVFQRTRVWFSVSHTYTGPAFLAIAKSVPFICRLTYTQLPKLLPSDGLKPVDTYRQSPHQNLHDRNGQRFMSGTIQNQSSTLSSEVDIRYKAKDNQTAAYNPRESNGPVTQVQFLHQGDGLQPPVTPVPGYLTFSSDLHHHACVWYTEIQTPPFWEQKLCVLMKLDPSTFCFMDLCLSYNFLAFFWPFRLALFADKGNVLI
ncbi:hypothetical protein STEG23_037310, partial [Scotinomys teguina]